MTPKKRNIKFTNDGEGNYYVIKEQWVYIEPIPDDEKNNLISYLTFIVVSVGLIGCLLVEVLL